MDRRTFLKDSVAAAGLTLAGGALGAGGAERKPGPNDRIAVAVVGVGARGGALLNTFASLADVDIKYVCDVDERLLNERLAGVTGRGGARPTAIKDFRHALDDKAIDAVVLGTPDHWHAIPTILACQAGKDVYVEKPDGHNVLESQTMVAAARKYGRIVQLGTHGRSRPDMLEAMEAIGRGILGRVRFAKAWESSQQPSIGHPADSQPPPGVDYDMWLGPAPLRPFNVRRFHGSWRWFLDYGTGDLGNDGVHRLDMAHWGLATAVRAEGKQLPPWPRSVSAHGGKYYFDDDQEWPDTMMLTYDYPGYLLTYELRIWSRYPLDGEAEGAAVYGDEGFMIFGGRRWRAFDAKGKLVTEVQAGGGDVEHARNFLDAMRTRTRPNADLETVGHPSSMLCHLGNAAWRAGRTLRFDPENFTFTGDPEANQYLTRPAYREPWRLPKISDL